MAETKTHRKNLLWLQSGGCGGCTLSLVCAEHPDFLTSLDDAGIDIIWHPSLSEASGSEAVEIIRRIEHEEIPLDILCLEGAVISGPNGSGRFHMASGYQDRPMKDLIGALAAIADYVVAVGSCAAFGGISAAGDNHIEAMGLTYEGDEAGGLLGREFRSRLDLPAINIAGCPTHPGWIVETLCQISANGLGIADLDQYGRPKSMSNKLAHHGCPRNEFYEFKASASKLCELGCLMENLGCKGTQAAGDCNIRGWNGNGSCITGGYPCIACTEPGFEEPGHPFVVTPKIAGIPSGLPTDMPKAWFVALASLSKAATPERLRKNAHSQHICLAPQSKTRGAEAMTRLIVGPFNRVEGDLEVKLDIADGVVASARVVSPLYRGFEHILQDKDPRDALVYAPRICGICSVSQSTAAVLALAEAQGVLTVPANGVLSRNLIAATENVADHLTHFYLFFMPDFARDIYRHRFWHDEVATRFRALHGTAMAEVLPARAQFMQILGLLAGKWPHTMTLQPGGTSRAVEKQEVPRLRALLASFRRFLERVVIGDELERFSALWSIDALHAWRDEQLPKGGDLVRFLQLADDLDLHLLGRANDVFMSFGAYEQSGTHLFDRGVLQSGTRKELDTASITEDVSHAWMQGGTPPAHPFDGQTIPGRMEEPGYTWCKAPRLSGKVVEVGALARQAVNGHPLILSAIAESGGNVRNRILARFVEIAIVIAQMERWVAQIKPGERFCQHHKIPETADGIGLVEAARGSLGHWLRIREGRISNYQIIAPTTWNFSPRDADETPGALEQALVATPIRDGEREPVAVQHVVRSFDPCMVCTVH